MSTDGQTDGRKDGPVSIVPFDKRWGTKRIKKETKLKQGIPSTFEH